MVALVAGLLAWPIALLPADLARRFPGAALEDYAPRLLGRWGGRGFLALHTLVLVASMGVDLAVTTRVVLGVFLDHTPLGVIIALGALVALVAAGKGPERLAYLTPVFLLVLVVADLLLIGSMHTEFDPGYLRPWQGLGPEQWADLGVWGSLASFRAFLIIPAAAARLRAPQHARRLVTAGHWLGWLVLLPPTLAPLLIFGPEGSRVVDHPFLAMVGAIKLPNLPLADRLELVLRPVGNVSALVTVGATLLAATQSARAVAGKLPRTWVKPVLLAAAWTVANSLARYPNLWQTLQWPLLAIYASLVPPFLFMWARALGQRPAAPARK